MFSQKFDLCTIAFICLHWRRRTRVEIEISEQLKVNFLFNETLRHADQPGISGELRVKMFCLKRREAVAGTIVVTSKESMC